MGRPSSTEAGERFSAVLDSGRQIASALSRQSVFSAVRDAALTLMNAERCLILEVSPGKGIDGVKPAERHGQGDYSHTVVERVLETGEPVLLSEDLGDDTSDSTTLASTPSLLCAPIMTRGEITACFYVVHDEVAGLFSDEEERVARFIGALAGASLENAETSHDKRAEKEAERLKNEFFSLVSHEFRTPLTSIVGYVDLLLDDRTTLTDEEHDNFLAVVKRNSVRLRRLVDDLLFISKVQSGKFSLTPRNVDLLEVVGDCIEAAKPQAERSSLSIELQAEELPPFFGDPDRLAQLFDNLISNAVKYTPEGERVEVRLANGGRQVMAEVTNTGAHLPADDLESIFEPFFRSETAISREAPGVGLGLTIVRSIVEAHGGRISVQSLEGVGTTFRVELPKPEPIGPETEEIAA